MGPPFAGWLYDYSKEWFLTFGLAGVFIGRLLVILFSFQCVLFSVISGILVVILPSVTLLKGFLHNMKTGFKPEEKKIDHHHTDDGCGKLDEV